MKKIILLVGITMIFFAGSSFAMNPGLFTYDKAAIETEMADLNDLEQYVLNNPSTTLTLLTKEGNPMASSITNPNSYASLNLMADRALGIGGFWWGCCLGPAGVLIVYLMADDKSETRSSIIGCVVSSLLSGGGILLSNTAGWGTYDWY